MNSSERYEYQTITLPYEFGILRPKLPDLDSVMNGEARKGWRLREILGPSPREGIGSPRLTLIFERQISG